MMSENWSDSDLQDLKRRGITKKQMEAYKRDLEQGFPFVNLYANAEKGRDIRSYGQGETDDKRAGYTEKGDLEIVKFVPASGAASRMFKDLFAALNEGAFGNAAAEFFENLSKFAFCERLLDTAGLELKEAYTHQEKLEILKALLLPDGMDYGQLPKGSIAFHSYGENDIRTAFEEHFYEAKLYAVKNGKSVIHFTVPAEQKKELDEYLSELKEHLSKKLEVEFTVQTSVQKPETDTPATYKETGNWARLEDDTLLFRPAGHGALIENLNQIDADVVFVKNIDNVVPDRSKWQTARYKELLAGVLLEIQKTSFEFLRASDAGTFDAESAREFLKESFSLRTDSLNQDELIDLLNRPIRVCGMVKNQGEPGGGPFIVKEDGKTSLQIVEKAQIDLDDDSQKSLLETATHFNPVDLVLGVRDYKGRKFDLLKFRNPRTGMRVEKTLQGRPIYALELPGLWNGAMFYWNTVFVEVPIETFNPVKTVLDLVRPAHLS
jgi:hypothetical protein